MATDPKARKPRDTLKDLLAIAQDLMRNRVKLRDSRGEKNVFNCRKLQQEAATLHRRLDGCLGELGVSLEAFDSWQWQLRQARDRAYTRGLMLGLGFGVTGGWALLALLIVFWMLPDWLSAGLAGW